MTLGRQIVLALWALLTMAVTILGGLFYNLSIGSLKQELQKSTEAQCQTLTILLRQSPEVQWERYIKTASLLTNCQIEIVGPKNERLLDSTPKGRLITGQNGRPAIHLSDDGPTRRPDVENLVTSRSIGENRTLRFHRPLTEFEQTRLQIEYGLLFTLLGGFTISAVLAFFVSRWLAQPLDRLSDLTKCYSDGELSARAEETGAPEIRALTARFHEMASRLEIREKKLESYVADASHELKTPLSSIRSLVESLKAGALDDKNRAAEFLDYLAQEVDRLDQLINRLLALHQLESGLPNSESVNFDLGELLAELSTTATLKIPDSGPRVFGDPVLVRQVVTNLLKNAEAATKDLREPLVELKVDKSGTVSVTDNGIGLEPEQASQVFQRFYQADPSRKGRGSGLGLAICKGIIEAHGGTISVESQPGEGSRFTFKLKTSN